MLAVTPHFAYHLPMAPHSQRAWYDIIWDHLHILAFSNLGQKHWQDHPGVWIIVSSAVAELVSIQSPE